MSPVRSQLPFSRLETGSLSPEGATIDQCPSIVIVAKFLDKYGFYNNVENYWQYMIHIINKYTTFAVYVEWLVLYLPVR